MATVCPSFLRGTAMRVTRLNACGQPVYGPCSTVTSDGFVTVNLAAEVEDGEEITVTKANGKLCVSERACDQLRWYTTEIEFCQVDPDLINIMNPTWDLVQDANGDTIGYDAVGDLNCDTGFALELWMDTYQAGDACAGGAEGAWGYLLLPWVVGGAPGDLEIGNDAISFSFNGRTKIGSRWRRGPYDVQRDVQGAAGPLLKPFNDKAHYRLFVTTVRPPEPECGCTPLDRPTPEPAEYSIIRGSNACQVLLRVDNHGFGPVTVAWCDDPNNPITVQEGQVITKQFPMTGTPPTCATQTCAIRICDQQTPSVCVDKEITLPLQSDNPIVNLQCDPNDPTGLTVIATVTLPSQAAGSFTLDFGDGTPVQTYTVTSGATSDPISHIYRINGTYRVRAIRTEATQFRGGFSEIDVPCQAGPTVTVNPGTVPATDVAPVVSDMDSTKTYTYTYSDGGAGSTGTVPQPSGALPNRTLAPGTYTLTVCETGTSVCTVKQFTVPTDPALNMVITHTCDSGDTTGHTVQVKVDNKALGQVSISGTFDAPNPVVNAGDNTAETTLVFGAGITTAPQITVTDSARPSRVYTHTISPWPCNTNPLALALNYEIVGDPATSRQVWFTATQAKGTTADFVFDTANPGDATATGIPVSGGIAQVGYDYGTRTIFTTRP